MARKTSLQETDRHNRVIYLFCSVQITPPRKRTICCANLTAFPYCFTNQAQVFQIVWAGKMYKLIISIIKSSRGHIMNPLFGQDGWILASFFLAFLLTSNFSRSKIKRAWPMSNHIDFTFGQKPLFLFFPSSSSLPFFFLFGSAVSKADRFTQYVGSVRRHGLWDNCSIYNVDCRDLLEKNDEETGD